MNIEPTDEILEQVVISWMFLDLTHDTLGPLMNRCRVSA